LEENGVKMSVNGRAMRKTNINALPQRNKKSSTKPILIKVTIPDIHPPMKKAINVAMTT